MSTHAVIRDDDYVIDQNWAGYTADDHAVWDFLYRRQRDILADRDGHYGRCPFGICGLDRMPMQASLPLFD